MAGTKNGFSFNAYGSYKGAEDYKNKYDGHVFNSKFNNKNFGGLLGYAGSWGHALRQRDKIHVDGFVNCNHCLKAAVTWYALLSVKCELFRMPMLQPSTNALNL